VGGAGGGDGEDGGAGLPVPGIGVRGVTRTYPGAGRPVQALAGVDLEVEQGRFVSLIGPSGCGKSTLLRAVAGLERVDSGVVTLSGRTPAQACGDKEVGFVPQSPGLLPWLTVRANAALPSRVNRAADRRRAARAAAGGGAAGADEVEAVLRRVGLGEVLDRYPHELSGGMQQRVAIARAFAMRPRVLLMDEPFSAVDELTREALRLQLLALWQEARTTVLFVTHSVREAVVLSDTVVVMSPRPGRTAALVPVELPRPRGEAVLLSPALHAVEDRLRRVLRDAAAGVAPA
jgi:NitT/TauT family transport system ATP-binding protein